MRVEKYGHSGKMGLAPFVVPLVGVLGSILLSFIYAYAVIYILIGGLFPF